MQACKPGSVSSFKVFAIYLVFSSQKRSNDLPTPVILTDLDEQPTDRSLFGLSTHKVCPAIPVARYPVGSYPTISPLPHWYNQFGGLFSVVLSVILASLPIHLPVRKYGALCCPDFPLSLMKSSETATNQPAHHKNKLNKAIYPNDACFY